MDKVIEEEGKPTHANERAHKRRPDNEAVVNKKNKNIEILFEYKGENAYSSTNDYIIIDNKIEDMKLDVFSYAIYIYLLGFKNNYLKLNINEISILTKIPKIKMNRSLEKLEYLNIIKIEKKESYKIDFVYSSEWKIPN